MRMLRGFLLLVVVLLGAVPVSASMCASWSACNNMTPCMTKPDGSIICWGCYHNCWVAICWNTLPCYTSGCFVPLWNEEQASIAACLASCTYSSWTSLCSVCASCESGSEILPSAPCYGRDSEIAVCLANDPLNTWIYDGCFCRECWKPDFSGWSGYRVDCADNRECPNAGCYETQYKVYFDGLLFGSYASGVNIERYETYPDDPAENGWYYYGDVKTGFDEVLGTYYYMYMAEGLYRAVGQYDDACLETPPSAVINFTVLCAVSNLSVSGSGKSVGLGFNKRGFWSVGRGGYEKRDN